MNGLNFEYAIEILKAYEDEGNWIVEGFAATSDFDLQEDIISQEAIEGSAKDLIENSTILHNHNPNEEIGRVLESKAQKGGLFLKILVSKTVPDIWQKIKEGVLNKFSVRGMILEAKKQWMPTLQKYARLILKMRLVEVSLVAVPANPKARAIRWYIEKALDEFEARGGEISGLEGGNNMPGEDKADVELVLEASGEAEGGKAKEEGKQGDNFEKADASPEMKQIARLAEKLLAGEQDEAKKKALAQIRDLAAGTSKAEAGDGEDGMEKSGRKIASTRLSRLKKLMEELQSFIREVDPEGKVDSPAGAPPAEETAKGMEGVGDVTQKLAGIEAALKRIEGSLIPKAGGKEGGPALLDKQVEDLAKRLSTLEGKAGTRASLEGQEALPGARQGGKSLWKGVV